MPPDTKWAKFLMVGLQTVVLMDIGTCGQKRNWRANIRFPEYVKEIQQLSEDMINKSSHNHPKNILKSF